MSRIAPVTASNTPAASAPLLAAVKAKLGFTPNMMSTMAHATPVLRGYLGLSEALASGSLNARERELIALAVGEANQCEYCVSAHAAIGKGAGLADAEVAAARQGRAASGREDALVRLAQAVARDRTGVSDASVAAAREAGFSDAELLEVVAQVALNVLTNTVNHIARTEVDFPAVPRLHG
ncbi:carboxymuconolactone decarboxylase family protein [Piscinibacter terrae]|uniref:Carboxymuconolactone decarboxylase family protein n=1 Tax=Piscinibacter terrae TaxID=2496871 RepID=A0A3N7HTU2_9BURK|nr:peroxidase-related enzyme [Albitalea terrae]RQP24311.1 carboxymuconolactone decarboxylase family protein [Albitalea terrae]